jgi:cellobiose-specific phosphotransferase system component IIA
MGHIVNMIRIHEAEDDLQEAHKLLREFIETEPENNSVESLIEYSLSFVVSLENMIVTTYGYDKYLHLKNNGRLKLIEANQEEGE